MGRRQVLHQPPSQSLADSRICSSCHNEPLLAPWTPPHAVPPFDRIEPSHFLPAFHEGIRLHLAEIEAISTNSEPPTFPNSIATREHSGARADIDKSLASLSTPSNNLS
jgi:Zn-dependent oligopeptidase